MKRKKFICLSISLWLLTACQSKTVSNIDIGDNFDVNYVNVNEIGVFGVIGAGGIGYYDVAKGNTIQILKNGELPFDPNNTQGICYYKDHIYYFDNKKNAALMVMDTNGKNQKKVLDFSDSAYDAVNTFVSFIYADNYIFFKVNFTKFNPDSTKNKTWSQLQVYDLKENKVTPITEKGLTQTKAESALVAYVDGKVVYSNTYVDDNVLSMSEYETKYKSTLNYPFYLVQHTSRVVYSYDMKSKKTEKLLEGKGIEFAQQNAKYDNKIVYRQGEDINMMDVNTKKVISLIHENKLYTIRSCLDHKIFYSTLEGDVNHIKYYDLHKNTVVESQAFNYTSDHYFFPDFETKAYFIGTSGEKRLSVIKKTDFYKQAFDKVVSIGW